MTDVYATYIGEGAFVNGVPARDLTKQEWDALTDEQRTAVAPLFKIISPKQNAKANSESAK